MPPRFAYWTILIDQQPTAFRARERDELLPTLHQLRRKSADVVMKWFARGELWESPAEAERARRAPKPPGEKRGRDWRPGGQHRDPRARFRKPPQASKRRSASMPASRSSVGRPLRPPESPATSPPPERPWTRRKPRTRR
jgi:hypothetical protein